MATLYYSHIHNVGILFHRYEDNHTLVFIFFKSQTWLLAIPKYRQKYILIKNNIYFTTVFYNFKQIEHKLECSMKFRENCINTNTNK